MAGNNGHGSAGGVSSPAAPSPVDAVSGGGGSGAPAHPGATMQLRTVAGTGGGLSLAARMQQSAPQPAPTRAPVPSAAELADLPRSLRDLESLAAARRDSKMKAWIRRYLRLSSIEPGRLEMQPTAGAPVTFAGDLAKRLHDWTGLRWVVTVGGEAGPTLEEAEAARRAQLIAEAEADPEVAAILAMMPGALVKEVRLRGEPEPEPEAPEPVAIETVSDADLPEQYDIDPSGLGMGEGDDDMGEGVLFDPDADSDDD